MVEEISRNFDRRSKLSDWLDSCQEVSHHVISLRACFPLAQHAQTKKPMNIRKLTYSIDPSVSWSEPLLEAEPLCLYEANH